MLRANGATRAATASLTRRAYAANEDVVSRLSESGRRLAVVGGWADITGWLNALRGSRPVFHSEADFQHALAWAIHLSDPSVRIRLETRPEPGMRLDLLVSRPDLGEHLALELKYLTAAWAGVVNGERFELRSQAAQDIRAYDVVKDIQRVERFVHGRPGWAGAVVVLTNDPGYWSRPAHGRATNAQAFRIYEDQVISGRRAWGPGTGAGTRKDREADLELRGEYRCRWAEYAALSGHMGRFRVLAITVDALDSGPGRPARGSACAPSELLTTDRAQRQPALPALSPRTLRRFEGQAPNAAPQQLEGEVLNDQRYTVDELHEELRRFERELRAAGLKENSVTTYVDRTSRFLKWLNGDYQPRGPN